MTPPAMHPNWRATVVAFANEFILEQDPREHRMRCAVCGIVYGWPRDVNPDPHFNLLLSSHLLRMHSRPRPKPAAEGG